MLLETLYTRLSICFLSLICNEKFIVRADMLESVLLTTSSIGEGFVCTVLHYRNNGFLGNRSRRRTPPRRRSRSRSRDRRRSPRRFRRRSQSPRRRSPPRRRSVSPRRRSPGRPRAGRSAERSPRRRGAKSRSKYVIAYVIIMQRLATDCHWIFTIDI